MGSLGHALAGIISTILALTTVTCAPLEPVHLGCFKTNLVDTQPNYYQAVNTSKWNIGVSTCIHRFTTYMGVQYKKGSSSNFTFFCGNDLNQSVRLEDSACRHCFNRGDRYCGQQDSMSVYQLRNQTPLAIYFSTSKGVTLLEVNDPTAEKRPFNHSLVSGGHAAKRIDLLYDEQKLFYTDPYSSVFESSFDKELSKYRSPGELKAHTEYPCLAMDWVYNEMLICENYTCMCYLSNGMAISIPSPGLCTDHKLDPYNRTNFFVIEKGMLNSVPYGMVSSLTFREVMKDMTGVIRISLDYQNQLVYAITGQTPTNPNNRLVSFSYDSTNFKVLYEGPQLTKASSLDVLGNQVVWSSHLDQKSKIYYCELSNTSCPEPKSLHTSIDEIYDILIYHPLKQTPTERFLCKRCSHTCRRESLFVAKCSCPEGLTLAPDNSTCEEHSAVHLGCYSTDLVNSQPDYYKIRNTHVWKEGVAACYHRYTTHMGVQADRLDSRSYFFCGNDLEESLKLNDSVCAPCVHPDFRYCGGPQAISLYRIKDKTPVVTYLATLNGVQLLEMYELNKTIPKNIIENFQTIRVDLVYSDDGVYYTDYYGNILRSFDHQLEQFSAPSIIKVPSDGYCVAVDWLNKLVYFSGDNYIMEYNMLNESTRQVFPLQGYHNCFDLTIDPYNRKLFLVSNYGMLRSFSMSTNVMDTFELSNYKLNFTKRVAVDYKNQWIYFISNLTDVNTLNLVRINYEERIPSVLFKGPELTDTFGLDVYDDTVFWVNMVDSIQTIYSCKVSTACKRKDLRPLHITNAVINDIIIAHPLKQIPPEKYLCKKCSHSCTREGLFRVRCSCPNRLTLGHDKATCEAHDQEYMGCFKTSSVETQPSYYKINRTLSWEEGVQSCYDRYKTYMGVQANSSISLKANFSCGNDLLDHSLKLKDSSCARCVDSTDRYCGGHNAMSLYKFRGDSCLLLGPLSESTNKSGNTSIQSESTAIQSESTAKVKMLTIYVVVSLVVITLLLAVIFALLYYFFNNHRTYIVREPTVLELPTVENEYTRLPVSPS